MTSFAAQAGAALWKRCAPNTAITIQQVADAIGVARYSVDRWVLGATDISGKNLSALDQFFRSGGDERFLVDAYCIPLAVPAPVATTCLWFTSDGACLPANAGHAEMVRRHTGLSIHVSGDLRASACRNRGWLAMEMQHGGRVTIWHHAKVSPVAAGAARDWLVIHDAEIASVTRRVEVNGTAGEVAHATAREAATALDRIANPPLIARIPLCVDRRSLDELPADLGAVLAACRASPDLTIPAAHDLGLMRNASILTVRGSSVTNDYAGPGIGFRREIVGKNLLDRGEPEYAAMVLARAFAALTEPRLDFITGEAYRLPLHYLSGAFPAGNSQVLTISRQLEMA